MFAGTYLCLMVGISGPDTLTARYGESGQYEQDKVRLQGIDASERKQPFRAMTELEFHMRRSLGCTKTDRYKRQVYSDWVATASTAGL